MSESSEGYQGYKPSLLEAGDDKTSDIMDRIQGGEVFEINGNDLFNIVMKNFPNRGEIEMKNSKDEDVDVFVIEDDSKLSGENLMVIDRSQNYSTDIIRSVIAYGHARGLRSQRMKKSGKF